MPSWLGGRGGGSDPSSQLPRPVFLPISPLLCCSLLPRGAHSQRHWGLTGDIGCGSGGTFPGAQSPPCHLRAAAQSPPSLWAQHCPPAHCQGIGGELSSSSPSSRPPSPPPLWPAMGLTWKCVTHSLSLFLFQQHFAVSYFGLCRKLLDEIEWRGRSHDTPDSFLFNLFYCLDFVLCFLFLLF